MVAVTTDEKTISKSVAQQLHLDFPILTDHANGLGTAFGIFQGSGHMGSTDAHSMFVIDTAGIIRWKEISPSMNIPMAHVARALAEAA